MDVNPLITEVPFYDELRMDGDVKALSPLLALYDKMVSCLDGKYEKEETMTNYGIEKAHLALYIRSSCPYCLKVTNYLKKEHKKIPTRGRSRIRVKSCHFKYLLYKIEGISLIREVFFSIQDIRKSLFCCC